MVAVFWPMGATREVTEEYSAPVEKYFNHESYCSALHLISAVGSWGPRKKESGPLQSNSTPARSRRFSPGGCSRYWLGFEVPIQFGHSYSFPCLCSVHTGPLLRGIWASPLFVLGVSDAAKKQQHLFFSSAVRKVAFFFSLHFPFSCKFLFVKTVLTTSNS